MPKIIFRPNPTPPPFVPPTPVVNYLTFTAQQTNSSVGFEGAIEGVSLQYSTDNGSTWNEYTFGNVIALDSIGDNVKFKGNNDTFSNSAKNYIHCVMTGQIAASGDLTTLLNEEGNILSLPNNCFYLLFGGCTSLTQAPSLPATTLADGCYSGMFDGCTSLTQAPSLPATTLADGCYSGMFDGCTSLTQAPSLPATTLANDCYSYMFVGCTSLTQAPSLPATTLANNCYTRMFAGCTSLTQAPSLPATTLADGCYSGMFAGCTSLTQAPSLPATTLVDGCYSYMFDGCTLLTHILALFISVPSNQYTIDWVCDVAQNGTFVKNSLSTWEVYGDNGIPTGWTVTTQ